MTVNAANARIFGSDLDAVNWAPLATPLPTDLGDLDEAFIAGGWLHTDGIPFTPSDSVQKIRGHQGGGVVRTTISESDLSFGFQALESKLSVIEMQHNVKTSSVDTGVATLEMSPARKVLARAFVIDMYDKDDEEIHWRYVIPRGEVGERSAYTAQNGDITGYPFTVEIIGDFELITNDPAIVDALTP